MQIEIVQVTPSQAEIWLATNATNNRRLRKNLVRRYATDMIKNEWQLTGEAIKIDIAGRLIDGQHRLSAVVASKKTVSMAVVTGLPEEVIQVLDTGAARSGADAVSISGLTTANANAIAALARKIIAYTSGHPDVFNKERIKLKGESITNREIVAFCKKNDLTAHAQFAARMMYSQVNKVFSTGEWAFLHWQLSQKSLPDAESFLTRLATLQDLSETHPIRTLFDKLVKSKIALSGKQRMMATITAWNAVRTNQPLEHIRLIRMDDVMPVAV